MRPVVSSAQLVVIDFQEKLFGVMHAESRERTLKNAENLLFLADAMEVPVVVTEQYPQGLGPTVPSLRRSGTIDKMTFSAMGESRFLDHLRPITDARPDLLVFGMETHICVALTVLDLRAKGYNVGVIADACLSRRPEDWQRGLALMERAGASIFSTETILFSLLEKAGTPLFKEISRRIR